MSYYINGKQIRKSTRTTDLKEAQKILADNVSANRVPDKRTVNPILDSLISDYEYNQRKSITSCKILVKAHLRDYFGQMKAESVTKQTILDYSDLRRKAGSKNASINREVSLLRRAFNIADLEFPKVPKLVENNVRKGFVVPEEYVSFLHKLPKHLRPIYQYAYRTGCRLGEVLNLKWDNVNLRDSLVRLESGETKNGEGRTIPLTSDLVTMFEGIPHLGPYVFMFRGKHIRTIKTCWKTVCKSAGVPDRHFHDLRRTGVRNLVRAGVTEYVAMSISGHKTRAIFDRYNIVSETDQKDAMAKLEASQTTLERQAEGLLPGKIDSFMVSNEKTPALKSEAESADTLVDGKEKKS
jgi:integrase